MLLFTSSALSIRQCCVYPTWELRFLWEVKKVTLVHDRRQLHESFFRLALQLSENKCCWFVKCSVEIPKLTAVSHLNPQILWHVESLVGFLVFSDVIRQKTWWIWLLQYPKPCGLYELMYSSFIFLPSRKAPRGSQIYVPFLFWLTYVRRPNSMYKVFSPQPITEYGTFLSFKKKILSLTNLPMLYCCFFPSSHDHHPGSTKGACRGFRQMRVLGEIPVLLQYLKYLHTYS